MKSISTAVLLFVSTVCWAADDQAGRQWLRPPPESKTAGEWTELPATDIYEVVASKEIVALVRDLPDKHFASLTDDTAKYFTGHYYRSQGEKKPFLVRAVYGQGGTGGYTVSRRGNDLLIHHGSLGHHSAYNKSALILNLDFTPRQVYIVTSIAE